MVSNQPASFGALLRQHRLAAGLTQSELAEEAGLSLRGVSDLERGARRTPYADTVRRLADTLRLPESERNDLLRASRRIGLLSHSGPAPRALPLPLTSFVGREHAVGGVERLLGTYHLVTLTGPGGIGKTRLALEVARKVAPEYTDAAALVDLNALSAPELVPETIAAALGVHRSARGNVTEAVADALRSRQLLLLLDNCEHLIEACAQVAAALLQACPNLRVLATSREPLGIAGEVTWIVPPLQVPRRDSDTQPSIQSLLEGGAVRLFVDRVRAVRPEYVPIQAEAADLAEVCCRLEGIPLAIELAAARAAVLSPRQIAARLEDPLRLLVGGSRTAPPRQQTLRATLEWSYGLLDDAEQRLFERLAVFAGGWTLEAAEDVCAGEGLERTAILDVFDRLVRNSLAEAEPLDQAVRYRLLLTVRQFATERLNERPEADAVRDRHAAFFSVLAGQADTALVGPDERAWLDRLELEHENIRAALRRLVERSDVAGAQRLAAALYRFWFARGHFTQGRAILTAVLHMPGTLAPTPGRAGCWFGMDLLALAQGDWAAARLAAESARSDWQALGMRGEEALALRQLGILELMDDKPDAARALFEQGLDAARDVGHATGEGLNLWGIAQVLAYQEAFTEAHRTAEAALSCFAAAGWRRGAVNVLSFLGDLSYREGHYDIAQALFEQSLSVARELGAESLYCSTLVRLGQIAIETGNTDRAATLLEDSLRSSARLGDRQSLADAMAVCSQLAGTSADWQAALRLASAASALRGGQIGGGPTSAVRARSRVRQVFEDHLAMARAALEEPTATMAWAAGQAMSWDSAVAEALSVCTTTPV